MGKQANKYEEVTSWVLEIMRQKRLFMRQEKGERTSHIKNLKCKITLLKHEWDMDNKTRTDPIMN